MTTFTNSVRLQPHFIQENVMDASHLYQRDDVEPDGSGG
jgi:hypothetical protein